MSTDELLEKADQDLQSLDKSCKHILGTLADLKKREIANRCDITQRMRFEKQCKLTTSYGKLLMEAAEALTE